MSNNIKSRSDLLNAVAAAASAQVKSAAVTSPDMRRADSIYSVDSASMPSFDGDNKPRQNQPANGKVAPAAPRDITTRQTNPTGYGSNVPPASENPQSGDKLASSAVRNFRALVQDLSSSQGTQSQSPDSGVEITPDFAVKLAHAIFSIEGGAQQAANFLLHAHGQDEAVNLVKNAMASHGAFLQEAEQLQTMQKHANAQASAEGEYIETVKNAFAQATPDEQAFITKLASAHYEIQSLLPENSWIKEAYAAGADSADHEMEAAGGPEAVGTPEMEEHMAPGNPQHETPHSPEDLAQVVAMLVQSGEISEEDGTQILQELQQAMSHGGGEGQHHEAEMAPETQMAPEGTPEEEGKKTASATIGVLNSIFSR